MDWDLYSKELFGNFELSDNWVSQCANYLEFLFEDLPKSVNALDFGFGRGNWSVALLKLGITEVLALDISSFNVKNLSSYCSKNHIRNIKPLLVKQTIDSRSEYFPVHYLHWSYGVIQHLAFPRMYFNHLSNLKPKPLVGMIYAYEKSSFRAEYVGMMRKFLSSPIDLVGIPEIQSSFVNRRAYQRFIDDFGAAYVHFFTESELLNLTRNALGDDYAIRRTLSFNDWRQNYDFDFDFSAIHLIFEHKSVAKKLTHKFNFNYSQIKDIALWRDFQLLLELLALQFPNLSNRIEIAIELNNILYGEECDSLTVIMSEFIKLLRSKLKID